MFGSFDFNKNYPNGDKYRGEAIESGLYHGKGTFTWANGDRYSGAWTKGRIEGTGVLTKQAAEGLPGFTYTGDFKDGKRQGKGLCVYDESGVRYEGDWQADERHGAGEHVDATGFKYTGSFSRDVFSGLGSACYPNGDTYTGEWAQGVHHGQGTLHRQADSIKYTGGFTNGRATGTGCLVTPAYEYTGEVVDLVPEGTGELVLPAAAGGKPCERYKGAFANGVRNGRGEGWVQGEWVYTGGWWNGRWHGHGKLATEDGIYSGEFTDGERNGQGCYERKDKSFSYKGAFAKGRMEGAGALKVLRVPESDPFLLSSDVTTGARTIRNASYHYTGAFLDGKKNARNAKVSLSSGYTYEGSVEDDDLHGFGVLTAPAPAQPGSARRWKYEGHFVRGLFEGAGEIARPGHVYKGGFRQGLYAGRGRLDLDNGDYYEGSFDGGIFNGIGTWYCAATSDTYEGEWQRGVKCGHAIEIKYGHYHYTGTFKDNEKDGAGTIKFANGDVYKGGFLKGKYHSHGTLQFANGSCYNGGFQEGVRWGKGDEKLPSGALYAGDYVNDVWHGIGRLTTTNNDRYEGSFANGKKHGPGMYYYQEGSRLACRFDNDVLHGEGEYHYPNEARPPTVRTYHQGTLVVEKPLEAYPGPCLAPFLPPVELDARDQQRLGNVRTKAAALSDHGSAAAGLQAELAALEGTLQAGGATPSQAFALKKKVAGVKARILREDRLHNQAMAEYSQPAHVQIRHDDGA